MVDEVSGDGNGAQRTIESWMSDESVSEYGVFVELRWSGAEDVFYATDFASATIASAAEQAVAQYLMESVSIPDRVPFATVYWRDGAKFGPFPVEISWSIEAGCLRRND